MNPDVIFKKLHPAKRNVLKQAIENPTDHFVKTARLENNGARSVDNGNDEDARYTGSGTVPEYEELMDYVDKAESEPATIDASELKKRINQLEKIISENTKIRTKYPDDPLKFMDSDWKLTESIKKITQLWDKDLYAQLIELNFPTILSTLLSHENEDICLSATCLFECIIEEEIGDNIDNTKLDELKLLILLLFDSGCYLLLIQNLSRFKELKPPEERTEICSILNIIENTLSINPDILIDSITEMNELMGWLTNSIKHKEYDYIRLYSTEIISIFLLNNRSNRLKFSSLGGVERLLEVISVYRKKDPETLEEVEYLENSFDSLIACLCEPEIKEEFLKLEGIDLMILTIKSMKHSRASSMVVLDTALEGPIGLKTCKDLCDEVISIGGLKYLFPAFSIDYMKKYYKKYKKHFDRKKDMEAIIGIIFSLFRHLNSPTDLQRLLYKFQEHDFERVESLLSHYKTYLLKHKDLKAVINDITNGHNRDIDRINYNETEIREDIERNLIMLNKTCFIITSILAHSKMTNGMTEEIMRILDKSLVKISELDEIMKEYLDNFFTVSANDEPQKDEEVFDITKKIAELETNKVSNLIRTINEFNRVAFKPNT